MWCGCVVLVWAVMCCCVFLRCVVVLVCCVCVVLVWCVWLVVCGVCWCVAGCVLFCLEDVRVIWCACSGLLCLCCVGVVCGVVMFLFDSVLVLVLVWVCDVGVLMLLFACGLFGFVFVVCWL